MTTPAVRVPRQVRGLLVVHGLSATAMGLPWPALLVAVWETTHSEWWLGVAGASRLAPYVLLSWLAGRCADRWDRARCLRFSLVARVVLTAIGAAGYVAGSIEVALVAGCLTVAAGTPAYPALAAEMPNLAGPANDRATGLLVTIEVAAFFVGPAIGGLALGWGWAVASMWLAVALMAAAAIGFGRVTWTHVQLPAAVEDVDPEPLGRLLLVSPRARAGLVVVAVNNAVDGVVSIALLPLAVEAWHQGSAAFGLATAALGLGALFAPVLLRVWGLGLRAGRYSVLLFTGCLVAVAVSVGLAWAVLPIVVIGASSVQLEAVSTALMQEGVPDRARSSLLGLADSVMVGSAAATAAVTPFLTDLVGSRIVLVGCAVVCGSLLLTLRRQPEPEDQRYLSRALSIARR